MLKILKKILKKKRCAAVIVAAGSSNRMMGIDKTLYQLGDDPIIAHSIRAFQCNPLIAKIVVVTREEIVAEIENIVETYAFDKVVAVVSGGATRAESVMKGLDKVADGTDYVAVHDGARPFVTQQIISDAVKKAYDYHATAPAVPVKDTIKIASNRMVTGTPDRATLYAVQTPQIFDFDLLRGALSKALNDHSPITDDCSAVEAIGMSVYLTEGADENIKITTPTDLILAKAIWEGRKTSCE